MAYLGVSFQSKVVPDGIEPSFPGCEPSVVAVGPRDCVVKWTHPESHRDLRLATPASSCWTMSPSCERKPWDSNPQALSHASCFQNSVLIRPDDFRLQAAGVGIEPTASWFRARRHYQQQLPRNRVRKLKHSVRESHPICELQRLTPRLRAGESVLRESNPPRQVGSLEPLPLGQGHKLFQAEGEGVEPSRP